MLTPKPFVKYMFACLAALSCASCGPRMRIQPNIQPFEQRMPAMPAGTVPTRGRLQTVTAQVSKASTTNPLPRNKVNLNNGKIYYGYYCLMCHGVNGDGNGPAGQSYVPKPTDLSSTTVTGMSDGDLYRRMLSGVGHDPVMSETVPLNQRWQIVMHVRTFAKPAKP